MKALQSAAYGPHFGYRAISAALLGLIWCLGANALTAATDIDHHPEFNFPAFEVEAYAQDITLPTPVKIVAPWVGKKLRGTEITMTFHISESGYVSLIEDDASRYDNDEFELACLMHRKLRQWRFEPALDKDGNAVCVKVKLPVSVLKEGSVPDGQVASLAFKRPVIVAVAQK